LHGREKEDRGEEDMAANDDMPAQVGAAYKDATDNLIFLKRQQWQVINYSIIVQAALYVLWRDSGQMKMLLHWLTVAPAAVSILVLWIMHLSMRKFRERLTHIYESYFSLEERQALRLRVIGKDLLERDLIIWILTLSLIAWVVTFKLTS
jgi:hypothetical protein